jgi:hypothetical protein
MQQGYLKVAHALREDPNGKLPLLNIISKCGFVFKFFVSNVQIGNNQ